MKAFIIDKYKKRYRIGNRQGFKNGARRRGSIELHVGLANIKDGDRRGPRAFHPIVRLPCQHFRVPNLPACAAVPAEAGKVDA
jgi:hypothetical protein